MKLQVLTTSTSAWSGCGVSSWPRATSWPIMTSLSTRFLGQPRLTKPIFKRVSKGKGFAAFRIPVAVRVLARRRPVRIATAMAPSPPTHLRTTLEQRLSQLSLEMEGLFGEARERARREMADQLNQAARRIRQAAGAGEIGATLLDATAAFAGGCALFRLEGGVAKGGNIRGVPEAAGENFAKVEVPLASAAALAGAVESRDPVVAAATPAEVSQEMVDLAGHAAGERVSIFPLVVRDRVAALLYAWGQVQGSAVELLAQVAALAWSAIPVAAPAGLVAICRSAAGRGTGLGVGPLVRRGTADPFARPALRARPDGGNAPAGTRGGAERPSRQESLPGSRKADRRRAREVSPDVLRGLPQHGGLSAPGTHPDPGQ